MTTTREPTLAFVRPTIMMLPLRPWVLTLALGISACSSGDTSSGPSTDAGAESQPTSPASGSAAAPTASTDPVEPTSAEEPATTSPDSTVSDSTVSDSTVSDSTGPVEPISTTPGAEIGRASTGYEFSTLVPWDVSTIYVDDATPEFFEIDYNPADATCIAAETTATIGRGGAILLSLFVDGDHEPATPCPGPSGKNRIPLTLDEPLAGRHVYTDSTVYYGEEAAAGERLSDEVIGLTLDDAEQVIKDAGFRSEVIPDEPGARKSIHVFERINLYVADDGTVEFAWPG